MLNIEKVRALSKERGISMNFLCSKIGVNNHYFLDVAKKKIPVPNERIIAIADLLGTSPEYLCDKTDDPTPKQKNPALTESQIDLDEIDPVKAELIKSVLSMKREDVEKISQFFDLLKKS